MKTLELNLKHIQNPDFGRPPSEPNFEILKLSKPHIDSFNYFLEEGIYALEKMPSIEFATSRGDRISVTYKNIEIGKPKLPEHLSNSTSIDLYPKECIERGCSYTAPLFATVVWLVNQRMLAPITHNLGEIPIMVKSKCCHLVNMTPEELVSHGELANETGGYFIVNGSCRVIRLLVANRRNYPIALSRTTWKMRDTHFSDKGILVRCVSDDQTSSINVLHHLNTGGVKLEFQISREVFFIPLVMVLKSYLDYSDSLIYEHLIRGRERDNYYKEKVKMMLRQLQDKRLFNRKLCREYIGSCFRNRLTYVIPEWFSDDEVCDYLLSTYVLIHLETPKLKFESLCMMTRKLYSFVGGECLSEGVDAVSMQEATLGGSTFLQIIKEQLAGVLMSLKYAILMKNKEKGDDYVISDSDIAAVSGHMKKIGPMMQSFLATGTLPSKSHCGLMQTTGLTVIMDHLNRMRDLSHLRAIHRGSYFLGMKTVTPRRLTGEAWGFICPVHTPDGAPCGLLNHLSHDCVIPCEGAISPARLVSTLVNLGMTAADGVPSEPFSECLEVVLDGGLVGYISKASAEDVCFKLRYLKVTEKIYKYTEIVLIGEKENQSQYAGLFLCTSPCRLVRPVINLDFGFTEYIGSLEQQYLNVAVSPEDIKEGIHSHLEMSKTSMLSNVARFVPFSDCNPNPRNMYQCQMGKQTMGMPIHNWRSQTFSKLYRLQSPQIPLGYDMEDAMVINKSAMERGLAHGSIYKSEFIDLNLKQGRKFRISAEVNHIFRRNPVQKELRSFLDENGLPYPGTKLVAGDPYYCFYDVHAHSYTVVKYKGEDCVVDKYSLVNSGNPKLQTLQKVNITIRIRRDPIIGDKFASRSGQKGIMSRLYPMEDLPFSERGIVPDIIFNPHGIPSRMTAGTLIDLVAGKCAAEFGKTFDSSPFQFNDENPAFDYFGKILQKAGFNYYGEDVLYSGTDGRMMQVKIFEGIVYYQRLRHMTADKWQVRATGPIDTITRQPIKGRKRGGAIRFGEMERDCLISHGAAFTLKDRLLDCSDDTSEWICSTCGGILSTVAPSSVTNRQLSQRPECSVCGPESPMRLLHMPYAFKYLVTELASIGIKTELGVQGPEEVTKHPILTPL